MKSAAYSRVTGLKLSIPQQEVEMEAREIQDQLTLYGQSFTSRLLLGTARYDSPAVLAEAIRAADPALLTVSVRRQFSASKDSGQSFWSLLRETQRTILPNTAGCLTAREAVRTACIARELFQTKLVKLEVIGDEVNLQPDAFGLVEAAIELVRLGFQVLPYCTEDWVLCRRLMDAGCEVIMPWAAPIGTGQGPRNPRALRELRERAPQITLIVDAGIGLPSHACQVMEWGFDGVLLNTAVSRALDPVRMAGAFANAVRGGRSAFLAGPISVQEIAVASTPEIGRPFTSDSSQPACFNLSQTASRGARSAILGREIVEHELVDDQVLDEQAIRERTHDHVVAADHKR
jgi:thiazole synthase